MFLISENGCVGVWGNVRFGQAGPFHRCKKNTTDVILWLSNELFGREKIVSVVSGWSFIVALTGELKS